MHRQQSTGSTEKGCDSQNMDKRRTAVNIGCICLIFLFIFGFYKCIQWDNTSRREQEEAKEQKELDEKAADEKAYEQAKEYMENYRISLQKKMRAAGIEDLRVIMNNTIRERTPILIISWMMIPTISIFIMN